MSDDDFAEMSHKIWKNIGIGCMTILLLTTAILILLIY